ncbi:sugar phosphate nucleotidyltransferase, partial [Salmonella enterica subsp. enterica serovar Kentucky]|nr:sugar phosphate nucleotidyltransferase [Salmonella enterica subsp. enterica serovar Kentucky]
AFRDAVRGAMPYADAGKLVTFGIVPDLPETGYGYIRRGDVVPSMIQNEATRPLVFSPAYYQTKQTLLDIKNLKVTADTVHVYRY